MKNFENLMIVPSTSKVDPDLLCSSLKRSWRKDVTTWEPEIKTEELLTFLGHLHSVGVNALALHKLKNSKRYGYENSRYNKKLGGYKCQLNF